MKFVIKFSILAILAGCASARHPNPALFTGTSCKTNADCSQSTQSFCNELGKCECYFPYFPQTFTEKNFSLTICTRYQCKNAPESCAKIYGDNAVCRDGLGCQCDSSFKYNFTQRECLTDAFPLNGACRVPEAGQLPSKTGCGEFTGCDGTCQCVVGSVPVNKYACYPMSCQTSQQCSAKQNFTACNLKFGLCECAEFYTPAAYNTKCVRRAKNLGDHCVIGQCGLNATCASSTCICLQGYERIANNPIDCRQVTCHSKADCTALDANSVCSGNFCTCRDGYIADFRTEKCQNNLPGGQLWIVFFTFVGAAGLAGLGIAIWYFVRKSHQQRHPYT